MTPPGRTVSDLVNLIHHRVEQIIGNELPGTIWSEVDEFFTEMRDEVAAGVWGAHPDP